MKLILTLFAFLFLILSCKSEPKKETEKENEVEEPNHNVVKKPFEGLKSKVFYEGIKKEGTTKLYKFRVDSIGPDGMTMLGVSLFGEEEEISGLAMSANSDSAMVYTVGDKLVVELYDGVANFFKKDKKIKTESFIKKEYRFNAENIQITKKHPPKKKVKKESGK